MQLKLCTHIGSACPRYVLPAPQPLPASPAAVAASGNSKSCPLEAHRVLSLLNFGSDPKMGSAEMLSAFSFLNLAMPAFFLSS